MKGIQLITILTYFDFLFALMWEQITQMPLTKLTAKRSLFRIFRPTFRFLLATCRAFDRKMEIDSRGYCGRWIYSEWRMHLFRERLLSHFVNRGNKFTVKILCEFLLISESPLCVWRCIRIPDHDIARVGKAHCVGAWASSPHFCRME